MAQAFTRTRSCPGPGSGSSTSLSRSVSGPPGPSERSALTTSPPRATARGKNGGQPASPRPSARRLREGGQLGDVGRLVLDDRPGAKVAGDPVVAVHRRQCVGAVMVERGDPAI